MTKYERERSFSDRYLTAIKAIVGPMLLEPASFEVDTKQATDLVILTARDMRIAARIRRPEYMDRYGFEFTLRAKLDSGAPTELQKIVDGWGDWLFYGFGHPEGDVIAQWWLIDLHRFRAALIRHRNKLDVSMKDNRDGTHFCVFDLRLFPESILIAGSRSLPSLVVA